MSADTPRILIIDDDLRSVAALAELLESRGYSVFSAKDGREALETLKQGPLPKVIIVDLGMPMIDGFEFRRRQRANPSIASIPVIVVTGSAATEIDADLVLRKPVQFPTLMKAIERMCQ